MKTESVHYEADGLKMIGHLAYDETISGSRPAVLVFPEAFGLGDHAKSRAERAVDAVADSRRPRRFRLVDARKVKRSLTAALDERGCIPHGQGPPLPTSKVLSDTRQETEPMWTEVGWSRRPQMTLSSILISPIRPVATKSIGTAVFSVTSTCE